MRGCPCGTLCETRPWRGFTRELMLTTTGRSCFTSGASEGIGPTCLTVSAVVVGFAAAACASAARKEVSDALR